MNSFGKRRGEGYRRCREWDTLVSEWGRGGGGYKRRKEGLLREQHQGGSHSVQQQVDTFPDFITVLGDRDMFVLCFLSTNSPSLLYPSCPPPPRMLTFSLSPGHLTGLLCAQGSSWPDSGQFKPCCLSPAPVPLLGELLAGTDTT